MDFLADLDTVDRQLENRDKESRGQDAAAGAAGEVEQTRKRPRQAEGVSDLLQAGTPMAVPTAMPPAQRQRRPPAAQPAAPGPMASVKMQPQARTQKTTVGATFEDPPGKSQDPDQLEPSANLLLFHSAHGVRVDRTGVPAALISEVTELIREKRIRLVLNISLNAGFFADAILQHDNRVRIISIDPMRYSPVPQYAASYLGRRYQNRHVVLAGSPTDALKCFANMFRSIPVGLLVLDLRADAPQLRQVLEVACTQFLRPGTPVVVNNLVPHRPDGARSLTEWAATVKAGIIREGAFKYTDKVHELWVHGSVASRTDIEALAAKEPESKVMQFTKTNPEVRLYEFGQRLDKARTCERALEVWEELERSQLAPDSWAYNSVLKWLRRDSSGIHRGMLDKLRAEMKTKGFAEIAR